MIFQAHLAVIMIQFENSSDQKSLPRKQLTNMLDKWFFLAHKVCSVFKNFYIIGQRKIVLSRGVLLFLMIYFQIIGRLLLQHSNI